MATSRHTARDARAPGWYWSDNDLIDHYGPIIGAYGIAVYSALARYADRDGRAFPSYERLANQLAISRRTVMRTIATLAEQGLVEVEPRTKPNGDPDSNCYVLVPIAQQRHEHPAPSDSQALPSDSQALGVVTHRHGGSDSQSPKEDSWNKTHDPPPPPNPPAPAARAGGGGDSHQDYDPSVARLFASYHILQARALARRYREQFPDVTRETLTALCERFFDRTIAPKDAGGRLYLALENGPPELPKTTPAALTPETYAPPARLPAPADPDRMRRLLAGKEIRVDT